ncbi:hypothetical protein [Vibrio viridaestus]|uniref:Calcium-binding protein n=1 Tax=Vibrio viridaestus TaxID=2487322 RepID=A0A3N9TKS9_9VIBR|nr:hypothetical protein [Vibrio viridaestus]RQW64959.1 hypothetical protein EES38_02680 [Vibrio viridaestus]
MSVINTGTTNTDGTGSATNLDESNATLTVTDGESIYDDGAYLNETDSSYVYVDEWNKDGFKEAQVYSDDSEVIVNNFVDVDIENSSEDAHVYVYEAKRGNITTSDGDDTISVSVKSNNINWSNTFNVNSGNGDDIITFDNYENSQNTSLNIDAGDGNDTVDISGLNVADVSEGVSRDIDGGDGLDTLVLSSQTGVTFENFEVITAANSDSTVELTLDSDLLATNGSEDGLVLTGFDVDASDFDSASVSDLSADDASYLSSLGLDASDYTALTVDYGDTSYHVLTDDSDLSFVA